MLKAYPADGVPQQVRDDNGLVLAGGFIFTYFAGTTTPATTWQDGDFNEHTNPIVLDEQGMLPGTGLMFLNDTQAYKLIIRTHRATMVGSYDNVVVGVQAASGGEAAESTSIAPRVVFLATGVKTPIAIGDPVTPVGARQLIYKDASGPGRFHIGDPNQDPPDVDLPANPGVVWTADLLITVTATDAADIPKVKVNLDNMEANWAFSRARINVAPLTGLTTSFRLYNYPDRRFQVSLTTSAPLVGGVDLALTATAVTVS